MKRLLLAVLVAACTAAASLGQVLELETSLAIRGIAIVPAPGERIEKGTILIEHGRIVAVGADVTIPPGTREIDGSGLVAYAGFIDGLSRRGVATPKGSAEEERRVEGEFPSFSEGPVPSMAEANRNGIFARRRVEDVLSIEDKSFEESRQAGFTTALLAPPQAIVGGRAAVVSLGASPLRSSLLAGEIAQTVSFEAPPERTLKIRGRYPRTPLGIIAHLRQFFSDAQWYRQMSSYVGSNPSQRGDLPFDIDLQAIQPVVAGEQPVVWEADSADEIGRVLKIADEFGLRVWIAGGREAWRCVESLKAARMPIIASLWLPRKPQPYKFERDSYRKAADDDSLYGRNWEKRPFEPKGVFEEAQRRYDEQVANLIALEKAGLNWCLTASELKKPGEVLRNLRSLVDAGLSVDAAVRALTVSPAAVLGLSNELGTLSPGKRGNVTILTKPLGEKGAAVRWVVIDGRPFEIAPPQKRSGDKDDDESDERRPRKEASLPPGEGPKTPDDPRKESSATQPAAPVPTSAPASQPSSQPTTTSAPAPSPLDDILLHEPDWPVETDPQRLDPGVRTGGDVLLTNAYVIPVVGPDLEKASILVRSGKIAAVGSDLAAPEGVRVIDLTGCVVMPGMIDPHSHIALSAVNEWTNSVVPEVRCRDVVEHDDKSIYTALAGGVTTIHTMHGSANTIGGQNVILKLKYGRPADELILEDAPATVKFALGENVKRSGQPPQRGAQGEPRRFPGTRMGVEATMRRALYAGRDYAAARERHRRAAEAGKSLPPMRRDLRLEALADILGGKIWVNTHCYRADEILRLLAVAEEFGIRIGALHHCLEAYRLIPEIARHGCGTATFADWWAYKIEAYDAVPQNAGMLLRAGINSCLKSDSGELMRHMNQEAAKAMKSGGLSANEALRLVTLNPARLFSLEGRIGSIEVGKDADLAVFEGHPLDNFSRCVLTLVEGEVHFRHRDFAVDSRVVSGRAVLAPPQVDARPGPVSVAADGAYAIVNGDIYPVSGPPIPGGTLLIRDGNIAAVGAGVVVPEGAQVIDAKGMRVYPGLINAGTQLGLYEIGAVDVTVDTFESGTFQPDLLAVSAFNPHSAMIEVTRAEGITSALIVPALPVVAGHSGHVELSGWTMAEMVTDPQVALVVNLPSKRRPGILEEGWLQRGDPNEPERSEGQENKELAQAEKFFRDARLYADAILAAGTSKTAAPVERDPRFDAMIPYVTGRKPVLFNANSYKSILETLLFAEQVGVRPILFGGRDAWMVAGLLSERGVPVIYDGVFDMPGQLDRWDANYRALSILADQRVQFCIAHRDADLAKLAPIEVGFAVGHGLDPDVAVRAMTLSAAKILGIADRLGSLEVGKQADVIVTTGHPCQATSVVRHVFIRGQPVSLESKHTRSAAKFASRPAPQLPPARTDLKGPPSQTRPALGGASPD